MGGFSFKSPQSYWKSGSGRWLSEYKVLVTKAEDLGLSTGFHVVEGENQLLSVVLWVPLYPVACVNLLQKKCTLPFEHNSTCSEWTNQNYSSNLLFVYFSLVTGWGKMLLHCPYPGGHPWTASNSIAVVYIGVEAFTSAAQIKHQQLQITGKRSLANARENGHFHYGPDSVYLEQEFPFTFSWSSWLSLPRTGIPFNL